LCLRIFARVPSYFHLCCNLSSFVSLSAYMSVGSSCPEVGCLLYCLITVVYNSHSQHFRLVAVLCSVCDWQGDALVIAVPSCVDWCLCKTLSHEFSLDHEVEEKVSTTLSEIIQFVTSNLASKLLDSREHTILWFHITQEILKLQIVHSSWPSKSNKCWK
jgi:hypothetical protein